MLVKLRAADYIANGLEIGPSFNGGISVKKYNHAVPSINIGNNKYTYRHVSIYLLLHSLTLQVIQ